MESGVSYRHQSSENFCASLLLNGILRNREDISYPKNCPETAGIDPLYSPRAPI